MICSCSQLEDVWSRTNIIKHLNGLPDLWSSESPGDRATAARLFWRLSKITTWPLANVKKALAKRKFSLHSVENSTKLLKCGESPLESTNGYESIPINTIFRGMNIHLPAIFMFTRGIGFWPTAKFQWGSLHNQHIDGLRGLDFTLAHSHWSLKLMTSLGSSKSSVPSPRWHMVTLCNIQIRKADQMGCTHEKNYWLPPKWMYIKKMENPNLKWIIHGWLMEHPNLKWMITQVPPWKLLYWWDCAHQIGPQGQLYQKCHKEKGVDLEQCAKLC